jgi:hypothetical protein
MATTLYSWQAKNCTPDDSAPPDGGYEAGTNVNYHYLSFAVNEKVSYDGKIPTTYGGGNVDVILGWVPPSGTSGSATWGAKILGRADGEAEILRFLVSRRNPMLSNP